MSALLQTPVFEPAEEVEVLPELTLDQAKQITKDLRQSATLLQSLCVMAYSQRIWLTMGYTSWDAYLDGEIGEERWILPRHRRGDFINQLAKEGMPTRAIASVVGLSHMSVAKEIKKAKEAGALPEDLPTIGRDGRTRKALVRKAPAAVPNEQLDLPVADLGIGFFKAAESKTATPAKAQRAATDPFDTTITAVNEKLPRGEDTPDDYLYFPEILEVSTELEELFKKAMTANNRQAFDPGSVSQKMAQQVVHTLLAGSGLLKLFNLQPDLLGDSEQLATAVDSMVITLDEVVTTLREDEQG